MTPRKLLTEQENKYKEMQSKVRTTKIQMKKQQVTTICLCYPWNVTHTLKQAQDYFYIS